jgi:peptide/nickel transport system permease protein
MRFVIRRLGFFVVTLWAAVTLNFLLPRMMPGNAAIAMMAQYRGHINPAALQALEIALGTNKHISILSAYFQYLGNCFTLNFGLSYTMGYEPVTKVVLQALPWTLGLIGVTTVLAFALGTLIGVVAGWRRGGALDSLLPPVFVIASAFPFFWIALLCIYAFSQTLHLFPSHNAYDASSTINWSWGFVGDVLSHAVLPAFTILLTSIGGWILTMRNNMITVLAEDYVRMARAKGLKPWTVMWGYAGRNAILPNLSGFAMSLGFVVSGAILVEWVFNYQGVGYMLLNAVDSQDYPLMQALFLLITVAVLAAVLVADVATVWLDPRTRETG